MKRFSLMGALCAIGVGSLAASTSAVETRFWSVDSQGAFEEGDLDGVSVNADGYLTLAPSKRLVHDGEDVYFWKMTTGADGTVYAGTGDDGRVYAIDGDDARVIADLEVVEVMAVAVAEDGTVYAAGTPGGVVYAITDDGTVSEFVDTEQGVVWDLAVAPDGSLLIACGETGLLLRAEGSDQTDVVYEATDPHVMCVVPEDAGTYLLGTAGDGLVCRVSRDGDTTVLYDAEEEEIRAIVSHDGEIYVAVNVAPASGDEDTEPAVYALGGYGSARRLWSADADFIFDLDVTDDGMLVVATGEHAGLYELDPRRRDTARLLAFDEGSVLSFVRRGDELLAGTGDPARLFAIGGDLAETGTVISDVRDAGAEATWSRIRWTGSTPGGTSVSFATRTGNRGTPDRTWSDWREAVDEDRAFRITSPAARYLQWRVTLDGDGSRTPEVTSVTTSYRERNLSPIVHAIDVSRKGSDLFADAESRTRSVRRRLPGGIEVDYSLPYDGAGRPVSPVDADWAIGLRSVSWVASDPNGDEMRFDLHYRPVESERWLVLAEDVDDLVYTWDASSFPDGDYEVRVTASDEPGNPDGALTDMRTSEAFEIDNTPPDIRTLSARLEAARIRVEAEARDERSAIVRADVSIDGREWQPARPETGLLDARGLDLEFALDAGDRQKGDPIVLRLIDEAGNKVVERTFLK